VSFAQRSGRNADVTEFEKILGQGSHELASLVLIVPEPLKDYDVLGAIESERAF
jgi:hypothetical protein